MQAAIAPKLTAYSLYCPFPAVHGNVHMLGRNYPSSVLGAAADAVPFSPYSASTPSSSASVPVAVKILARDLPGARTTTSIAGKTASGSSSKDAGLDEPTRIVHAACTRHHTLLVSQDGSVWACGSNPDGRLGVDVKGKGKDETEFVRVRGPWEKDGGKIIQVRSIESSHSRPTAYNRPTTDSRLCVTAIFSPGLGRTHLFALSCRQWHDLRQRLA